MAAALARILPLISSLGGSGGGGGGNGGGGGAGGGGAAAATQLLGQGINAAANVVGGAISAGVQNNRTAAAETVSEIGLQNNTVLGAFNSKNVITRTRAELRNTIENNRSLEAKNLQNNIALINTNTVNQQGETRRNLDTVTGNVNIAGIQGDRDLNIARLDAENRQFSIGVQLQNNQFRQQLASRLLTGDTSAINVNTNLVDNLFATANDAVRRSNNLMIGKVNPATMTGTEITVPRNGPIEAMSGLSRSMPGLSREFNFGRVIDQANQGKTFTNLINTAQESGIRLTDDNTSALNARQSRNMVVSAAADIAPPTDTTPITETATAT